MVAHVQAVSTRPHEVSAKIQNHARDSESCMRFRIVPPNYKGAESYVGDIGYVILRK